MCEFCSDAMVQFIGFLTLAIILPTGLVKTRIAGAHPQVSYSVGLG